MLELVLIDKILQLWPCIKNSESSKLGFAQSPKSNWKFLNPLRPSKLKWEGVGMQYEKVLAQVDNLVCVEM